MTQPIPLSDNYSALLRDAISHHQEGRLDDAESRYRQVLDRYPNNPEALHMLGVLSSQKGNDEAGIALIQQAIAADGRDPVFHSNLGNLLGKFGRLDEAAEAYEAAIDLQPKNIDSLADLGGSISSRAVSTRPRRCIGGPSASAGNSSAVITILESR